MKNVLKREKFNELVKLEGVSIVKSSLIFNGFDWVERVLIKSEDEQYYSTYPVYVEMEVK